MGGQHHAPAALPLEKTRYPLYRRLGGLQDRSGRVRKISPTPGFDPRTVQPVPSHYADRAIPASTGRWHSKIRFTTNKTAKSKNFLICTREGSGSNTGRTTHYPAWDSSSVYSLRPGRYWKNNSFQAATTSVNNWMQAMSTSFPPYLQFTIMHPFDELRYWHHT